MLVERRRIETFLIAAFAIFAVVNVVGLIATHVNCLGGYENETFMSHDRFARVILRTFHTFGLVFLLLSVIDRVCRRAWMDFRARSVGVALTVAFGAFLVWQGVKSRAGLHEVANRDSGNERDQTVLTVKRGVETIKSWAKVRPQETRLQIMIVAQNGVGFENTIARYHALNTHRGEPIRALEFPFHYSFGPDGGNPFMTQATPAQILEMAEKADVVWPLVLDAYAREALASILDRCLGGAFVVRAGDAWICPPR
jgi:hypothetical protein